MINVAKSSLPSFEEYCEEIKPLWETHWITNMGVKHKELQSSLEEYLGCKHVVLFANGHLALESAISALNLPKGGEVITTPFTFASTTHAIVRCGFKPVFCDINNEDYTIDTSKIEPLITSNTVAIIPVHVYGNLCDVNKIEIIAQKYKLKVIYDAAHAFSVNYQGVSSANFGDMSIFSFHATKVFNTVEGGAVCFNSDEYVQTLNDIKNFGIRNPDTVMYPGGNAKMSEFHAAMGICNLRHINEEIKKRRIIFEYYTERFSKVKGIRILKKQLETEHNYAYFPVVFEDFKYSRDEIYEKLLNHGICARKYFYPLTNSFDCYKDYLTTKEENTPIAQEIAQNVLTLPLFADLSIEEADTICNIILA